MKQKIIFAVVVVSMSLFSFEAKSKEGAAQVGQPIAVATSGVTSTFATTVKIEDHSGSDKIPVTVNQSESGGGASGRFEKWKDKVFDDPVELFTMILAIFTALLWWSTRRLWIEARDAGAVAKTSADAAKMAAEVARDSASAYINTERAWISLDSIDSNRFENSTVGGIAGKSGYFFSVRWINQGRTPALKVTPYQKFVFSDPGAAIPTVAREPSDNPDFVYGSLFPNTRITNLPCAFVDDELKSLEEGRRCFVYVHVGYEDIFHPGEMRITEAMIEVKINGVRSDNGLRNFSYSSVGPQNTAT
ncbi:hypothetical protein [Burkholderia ambifaria]|uniref:hypothetical protein n=1 Tax=Burkholderia ambifaria TaxID=152480 RepID=UPI00158C15D0|nr:hypothetical protein [Burkholderia ambifaria]MBR8344250.1 hypothetical protein [Burkholderia ambifaria]